MCEQDDLDEFARRSSEITRRQFGTMALSAGLVAAVVKAVEADRPAVDPTTLTFHHRSHGRQV